MDLSSPSSSGAGTVGPFEVVVPPHSIISQHNIKVDLRGIGCEDERMRDGWNWLRIMSSCTLLY